MKEFIEVIGPCSKWIDGKGWVTRIPVHLIENAGFVKKEDKNRAFWQGRSVGKREQKNDTRSN